MKTFILFLSLLVNIFSFSQKVVIKQQYSYGQIVKTDTFNVDKTWMLNTPGRELKLASQNFYTGLITTNVGVLLTLAGTQVDDKASKYSSIVIGGCATLIGSAFIISSHIHIKRAGIIMDDRGIGVSIPIKYKI